MTDTETIPKLALRKRQMAAALGVSVGTLDTMTREGFPHVKLKGAILYPVALAQEWLATHATRLQEVGNGDNR